MRGGLGGVRGGLGESMTNCRGSWVGVVGVGVGKSRGYQKKFKK